MKISQARESKTCADKKDEMTKAGFWKDDAQVASEVTEKFISDGFPGIYIRVTQLEDGNEK